MMHSMATARVPQQLTLDLPHRSATGAEDFLVSGSNEAAVAAIDAWPQWREPAMALAGPAGSGKSHLVAVWAAKSGAARLAAAELGESSIALAAGLKALAIEDADRGIGNERVFFHLLNLARETKLQVLVTTRAAPGEIVIALPDLRSRMRALPVVRIAGPDEALLSGLLVKLFCDRQLEVPPHVVAHVARHMERSMEAASRVVAEIDRLSLAKKRPITRAVAAEALERLWPSASEA